MQKSVFIVTKPLQYFNATNIDDRNYRICIIIDAFNDSYRIFKRLEAKSAYWNELKYFQNWQSAYSWVANNKTSIINLYIDTDYSLSKYFYLHKLNGINIFVYEEGIGNYSFHLKSLKNRIKRLLYRFLGHDTYVGGSKYTKGIYLYNPSYHKLKYPSSKRQILNFIDSFRDHLKEFSDKEIFLSDYALHIRDNFKNRNVLLYLTAWQIDSNISKIISEFTDYDKLVKLHPHIKDDSIGFALGFDYQIEGYIFVELYISLLLEVVQKLVVLHHGTSALMYFQGENKIIDINIGIKDISEIRNLC